MYYYVCIHHVEKTEGHEPSMVAPEFCLARQVRPYRPAHAYSQAPSSHSPRRRSSIPSTAIGSIPSLSSHASAYRYRQPPLSQSRIYGVTQLRTYNDVVHPACGSDGPIRIHNSLVHVCMYACIITHIARVWTNQVRLPVLHVVS